MTKVLACDDQSVELSPKAGELLFVLLEAQGSIVSLEVHKRASLEFCRRSK